MEDEYVGFPTKIFIDTNIVLESLPLRDLPWSEIDPVGPILVLVTPTLLSEIDSKKKDGRLGVRAREFNRLIAPIVTDGKPINIAEGPPRVDIMVAKCCRIVWSTYDDLDPSEGDARIIAEVLNVKGIPWEQRIVIGHDINPLFIAQRYGLKILHVSDNWLPPVEPTPQQKEISKLKRQISEYAKSEPHFEIKLHMQPGPLVIHQVQKLTVSQMSTLAEKIIAANPKPEQVRSLSRSLLMYDNGLDDRYERYKNEHIPIFTSEYHKKLELLFGQIPFTLSVSNVGGVRADRIKIDIRIIGGWFNRKPIVPHTHPLAPKIDPFPLSIQAPYLRLIKPAVGRHEFEIGSTRRSDQFSAQCEDFRHGQKWEFSGVVWLDPYQEREAAIIVKVTAANLHGENSTPFKLVKTVLFSQAFDLVDQNTGKTLKAPHIKSLIEEAIKSEEYDAIEWDCPPD